MRKVLLTTLVASIVVTMAGCLKDKGFEDQKYGINITEVKGVAFPQTTSNPIVYGINSQTTPQTVDGPLVTIEQEGAAASDVKVTLVLMTAAALHDFDSTLIPLNVSQFSVNSLTVTIAAGQKFSDALKITVTNAALLDATKSYAVGFTISAVDQGYKIAANQKNMVVAFNIKNKYDGKYNLRGYHNRTSPDYTLPYNVTVYMITSGPNSVSMWYPAPGPDDYAHPINGNGGQFYGTFTANFTFVPTANPDMDAITSWNWSPYPTTLPTAMGPATDSRWVKGAGAIPNKIYANFYYNNNPGARAFFDTLTYLGPRP